MSAQHVRLETSTVPDLLGELRRRSTQAGRAGTAYLAPVLAQDSMLLWLARAAVQAREAAGRKQVHVAASADRDQSSIYRFEQAAKGTGKWPRDPDRIIAAYADDLDIEAIELWAMALQMWKDDQAGGDAAVSAPDGDPPGPAPADGTDLLPAALTPSPPAQSHTGQMRRSKGSRRRAG